MIWLIWKLLTLPFRIVFGTVGLTFKTIRLVGLSRILAFGAGVGTGLAVAPTTGDEFRARLGQQYGGRSAVADLGEAVRHELAQSPRTWHLPQPVVTVVGNRVTLTGQAPHDTGRIDLGKTAGAVAGVGAVDNRIVVDDTDS